jgi:hypothetical protein
VENRLFATNNVTNTTGIGLYEKTSDLHPTFQLIGPVITPEIMARPIYIAAYPPPRGVSYVQLNGLTPPTTRQLGGLNNSYIAAIFRARKLLAENCPPATAPNQLDA